MRIRVGLDVEPDRPGRQHRVMHDRQQIAIAGRRAPLRHISIEGESAVHPARRVRL